MEFTSQEKVYYKDLFGIADADKDGKIGSGDAAFFRKSGVSNQMLGTVSKISNKKNAFSITRHELLNP